MLVLQIPPPAPTPVPPPAPEPTPTPVPSYSHISLSKTSLSFNSTSGVKPSSQTVSLSNTGSATMNWTVSTNQSWCKTSKTSGTLFEGSSTTFSVSVDAQVNGQVLNCIVAVSDIDADNSPQYINVSHTVTGSPDTTPPSVSITYPSNSSRVSGTITIKAIATDNSSVSKVEFYIDNRLFKTDTSVSYSYRWNVGSRSVTKGAHTILVKAYDRAGNISTAQVSVTK